MVLEGSEAVCFENVCEAPQKDLVDICDGVSNLTIQTVAECTSVKEVTSGSGSDDLNKKAQQELYLLQIASSEKGFSCGQSSEFKMVLEGSEAVCFENVCEAPQKDLVNICDGVSNLTIQTVAECTSVKEVTSGSGSDDLNNKAQEELKNLLRIGKSSEKVAESCGVEETITTASSLSQVRDLLFPIQSVTVKDVNTTRMPEAQKRVSPIQSKTYFSKHATSRFPRSGNGPSCPQPGTTTSNNYNIGPGVGLVGSNIPTNSDPLIYLSSDAIISIMLRHNVIIELNVDNRIRFVCTGNFSASTDSHGSASCIIHPKARIYQSGTTVQAEFEDGKIAVFGSQGIIFTMKQLPVAYIVSSVNNPQGAIPISAGEVLFPQLNSDLTVDLFRSKTQPAHIAFPLCEDIVSKAHYEVEKGVMHLKINEIYIKQEANGDVELFSPPRFMKLSPSTLTITVRTQFVDMGVEEDDKCCVKRGVKRVHVSMSGIVVSDGSCITSMDHIGRIVSNHSVSTYSHF